MFATLFRAAVATVAFLAAWPVSADGLEIQVAYEARVFPHDGEYQGKGVQQAVEARVEQHWSNGDSPWSATVSALARGDQWDHRRSSFDFNEAYVSYVNDALEVHAGNRRLFWGVLEFVHLVDVINSVDLAEDVDEETRFGQPMLQAVYSNAVTDGDSIQLFALAGHRDKRFPSRHGRLGGELNVDRNVVHEGGASRRHVDGALRYQFHWDALDGAVSHFHGTTRDPEIRLSNVGRFVAVYSLIDQTALELQWGTGDWAFKAEGYHRRDQRKRHSAVGLGFERTFVGLVGSTDVGLVGELYLDNRGRQTPQGRFEHDGAVGLRIAPNDMDDSQVLLGYLFDLHADERVASVEASTRVGDQWRLRLEGRAFLGAAGGSLAARVTHPRNKTALLANEDYLQLQVQYFVR